MTPRERMSPDNGKALLSTGQPFDWSDMLALQHKYSLLRQTVENGAVEFGKRISILEAASTSPFYYYLQIPSGRRLILWQRELLLTEGRYIVDLVRFPSGVTGGTIAYKKPLSQGASMSAQTNLYAGVTPVNPAEGVVVMELPLIDTGTMQGAQSRAGGAASVDGVFKTYLGGTDPVLIRITRSTSGSYTSSISLIAWEEDA